MSVKEFIVLALLWGIIFIVIVVVSYFEAQADLPFFEKMLLLNTLWNS